MTGASDIWALGAILYSMLAQVHPFPCADQSIAAIARRIVLAQEPPSLPQELNVPSEISQLISSMLASAASRRPKVKQVATALQGLLQRRSDQLLEQRSPFRGLLPFSERHADLFFGRNTEIEMALERLRHEPILPVVGPSGAGQVITERELLDGLEASASLMLDRLTTARMVVSRRTVTVGTEGAEVEPELVHDALIHSWKPLVRWLGYRAGLATAARSLDVLSRLL